MNVLKPKTLLTLVLSALSTSIAMAAIPQTALLESFETPPMISPINPPANPPYTNISQSSGAGVSEGAYSMQMDVTNADFAWTYVAGSPGRSNSYYASDAYSKWYNHKRLKLDLYRPPQAVGWNFNLFIAINNAGGWQQSDLMPTWPWLNASQSSTQTLTWDYSVIRNQNTPGGTWMQLPLAGRSTVGGTVFIDNVRFTTPAEPLDLGFTFPDSVQGWVPYSPGSTALAAATWDSTDADGSATSGSMYCFCDFASATTNQTAMFQRWDFGYDFGQGRTLGFDLKVDGGTSTLTSAGDYGSVLVVLRGTDTNWIPFGPYNIPASAAGSFMHFTVPLVEPLPTNMVGMNLIFGGTNLQGPINYYVDNVIFLAPRTLVFDKASPGLELNAPGTTTNQREGVRTKTGNYNWTTAAGDVTYSMTITEGLPAVAEDMMAYIFLVGTTGANPSAAGDLLEPDGIFLEIKEKENGLCNATLMYKTNSPFADGNRYTSAPLAVVPDVPMTGVWSLTMNQNNFSLSGPGGSAASGSLPPGVLARFTTNVFAYFGVQPNSDANLGQYVNLSRVQISGVASPVDQVFTTQSALNTNVLSVSAVNTIGVQMRPTNTAYRLSWPSTSPVYALESASSLNGPWSNPGLTTITSGPRKFAFVPATALPPSGSKFFRLRKQ